MNKTFVWLRLAIGACAVALPLMLMALAMTNQGVPERTASVAEISAPGELGSGSCRSCHPSQYQSWHQTFHRSMTRPTRELAWDGVSAPRLPARLEIDGRTTEIWREESLIKVRGPDLHRAGAYGPRAGEAYRQVDQVDRNLVLVTGSHYYLAFWVAGETEQELRQLPFVYLLDESLWIPRREAFLQPPERAGNIPRWNANCIQCHAVSGRPGQSEGRDELTGQPWVSYRSEVTELGIGCEACHGPGASHAEQLRRPWSRWAAGRETESTDTSRRLAIALPPRLEASQENAICGQCHSAFSPTDPNRWWSSGHVGSFAPGDSLEASRLLLNADSGQWAQAGVDALTDSFFWGDGTIRVGGRELNGLVESPCFRQAPPEEAIRCSSCHSMHAGTRDDQLRFAPDDDGQCTQCHGDLLPEHSRHPPESVGARCVNCHMPKTTYALLKSIRSHRITSPGLRLDDPPSACSLCHADRSRAWVDAQLRERFGLAGPEVSGTSSLPHALELALSGNAAERALLADHLTREETLSTAGPNPARTVLPTLRRDSYAAIRHIARRSQKRLDEARGTDTAGAPTRLLLSPAQISELVDAQDETPITISE